MPVAVLDHPLYHLILAYLGSGALLAALIMAAFAALLSFWAGRAENTVMIQVGRRAFYAAAALVVGASVVLEAALLTHDFSLAYVANHTDLATPAPLVAAAFYGGQEGSLLYWTLVLGLLGSASLLASASLGARLAAYAAGVLASIASFFLVVLVLVASPFELLFVTPPDGLGLNPVLRDGGMLIHPPVVLAGFASFAIPFSFAAAALLANRADAGWIAHTRRYALVAWSLQSAGLLLGMWWAYHVLGWGGYWGWDPVENVALMPWLATTAYLHSSQVQERRGRVHTFAISAIGPWFFAFLGVCLVFAVVLLGLRAGGLKSVGRPAAAVSREGAFVLQNMLLIGVVAVVLWGTILPLVSGLLGQERVVGESYYDRAAGPLFVLVLVIMGAGPLLPWRRAGKTSLRALRWPLAAAALTAALLLIAGVRSVPALLAIPAALAAAVTCLVEFGRAIAKGRLAYIFSRRRRYGAYLAHIGLVVVVVGVAASHFWQQERDVTLTPGQQVSIGGYQLTYAGMEQRQLADHSELVAAMTLGDRTLEPARATYAGLGGQSLTHVAISTTATADVYVIFAGANSDGSASFRILVNPLVSWIWAGGIVIILGVVLGNVGQRRTVAAPVLAPAPQAAAS